MYKVVEYKIKDMQVAGGVCEERMVVKQEKRDGLVKMVSSWELFVPCLEGDW